MQAFTGRSSFRTRSRESDTFSETSLEIAPLDDEFHEVRSVSTSTMLNRQCYDLCFELLRKEVGICVW